MSDVGALAEVLRAHRRRAGLTQQEAADRAGLSVAAIRDLEQGRVAAPRSRTLRRLGLALGLSPVETGALLRGEVAAAEPVSPVWIGVLGPLAVRVDGAEVDPGSEVQRVLLGLLALSPNVPVARDRLVARIATSGRPGATAGGLAARMSRLRRRLRSRAAAGAAPLVVAMEGGYALLATEDQVDLLAFQALVRRARRHLAAGEQAPAWEVYDRAVGLWRGEPLAGLTVLADDPAVVALTRQWPLVAAEYAAAGAELGHYDDVVLVLRRVAVVDPLHEVIHARLIVALAGAGRQAEALEVYDSLRRRLDRDLGAAPGLELVEAHRRVLRQEVTRPRIATGRARRTLPPDVAEFTGRAVQLGRLRAHLPAGDDPSPPRVPAPPVVIVIEGMAGAGKTRLALHFAHQLVSEGRYPGQQLYADLAAHTPGGPADPAAVLTSFLHLLGMSSDRIPPDLGGRVARYRERLREAPTLIVLDDAGSAAQLASLLPPPEPDGPPILCLVTSRHALALAGAYRLGLAAFTEPEAIELLAAIAGPDRVTDRAGVGQVVAACGRLPLAVGLVARRLAARPEWSLADLAARLSDPAQRLDQIAAGSQSLRAAFDASVRALPEPVRRQLRQLAGHPDPEFTIAAAASHLGTDTGTARQLVDQLRRVHLVAVPAAGRYGLHHLVRDYLREVW